MRLTGPPENAREREGELLARSCPNAWLGPLGTELFDAGFRRCRTAGVAMGARLFDCFGNSCHDNAIVRP